MYKNYLEIPLVCADCGSCDVFQRIDGKFYCTDCEKIVQIEPDDSFMGHYNDDDWQNKYIALKIKGIHSSNN